jgi:hypothetical protein
MRSAPPSIAVAYAIGFAQYVYREPAEAITSARLRATPGVAFHVEPSPSRFETRAASMMSCSSAQMTIAETKPPSWLASKSSGSVVRARITS